MNDMHMPRSGGTGFGIEAEGDLGFVLYRSVASPQLDEAGLQALLDRSRIRNRRAGLTGCLHHENGLFFQWLEGPRRSLFGLLDALRDDSRHVNLVVLDQGALPHRLFAEWEMRLSDVQAASLRDWLAVQPDPALPEARAVTEFLRSLAR